MCVENCSELKSSGPNVGRGIDPIVQYYINKRLKNRFEIDPFHFQPLRNLKYLAALSRVRNLLLRNIEVRCLSAGVGEGRLTQTVAG